MKQITKSMLIGQVFEENPAYSQKLSQIMLNAGINCVGCGASTFETIEEGMLSHGYSEEEIVQLVKTLNTALKEKIKLKENVSITKAAAEKIKVFQKNNNHMFKISLTRGSCGYTYGFKFQGKQGENELKFDDKGVSILVNKEDFDKLKGMEIDYFEGMQGAGFKISNPNARGTCGCGSSVSL